MQKFRINFLMLFGLFLIGLASLAVADSGVPSNPPIFATRNCLISNTITMTLWNQTCRVTAGENITITLPPMAGNAGRVLEFNRTDATAFTVTIQGSSVIETINGLSSIALLGQNKSHIILTNGTNAIIISGNNAAAGDDTQIQYNKAGATGASANLTYSSANNRTSHLGTNPTIEIASGVDPSLPAASRAYLYAKDVVGRAMFTAQGSSGTPYQFQPAMWNKQITIYQGTGNSTGISAIGLVQTSSGTVSNQTPSGTNFGSSLNFASSTIAASVAGIANTSKAIGTTATNLSAGNVGGFFTSTRLIFPDANYGTSTTGTRFQCGLNFSINTSELGSDNSLSHRFAFVYSTVLNETNLFFQTANTTTFTRTDTTIPFVVNNLYDMQIYQPPNAAIVYWRIANLTAGTQASGSTATALPTTTPLGYGCWIATLTTTARNLRIKRVYIESDN